MERQVTEKASHFKKRSSTIDKKDLRVHRRSLDWKQLRNDELNRRRNCDVISPVVEESTTPRQIPVDADSTPNRHVGRTGTPKKTTLRQNQESRAQQLKKWKKERELKKKIEAQNKKPVFKVTAIKHDQAAKGESKTRKGNKHLPDNVNQAPATRKPLQQAAKTVATAPVNVSQRTTRSSAAKAGEPAPKSATGTVTRSTRPARQSQPVTDPHETSAGRTTRSKSNVAPTNKPATQTRNKAATGISTGKKSKVGKEKQQSETENQSKSSEAKAIPDPLPAAGSNHIFQFNAPLVTMARGELASTSDFSFNAPANLTSFTFTSLSPQSVARFLDHSASLLPSPAPRRCSTPKFSAMASKAKERITLETATEENEEETEPVVENTKKKNSVTRQSSVRRSIRLHSADKLTTDGEESQDNEKQVDSSTDTKTSETPEEKMDYAVPLETPSKTADELMADSQSKNNVTDDATESKVTKTANCETSEDANCQVTSMNPQDPSQQQALDHVLENVKASSQRRRSTRRSLRLQSLQTETEQKATETEQVIDAEANVKTVEVTEEEQVVKAVEATKVEQKVMETKRLAEIQVKETEPAVNETESFPPVHSDAVAGIEANNTESILQQTTPVSVPRGRSRARRSLAKSITSEPNEPSEEKSTRTEESGNPTKAMTTQGPATRLSRKSMSAVPGFARPSPALTGRRSAKRSAHKQRSKSARRHSSDNDLDPEWIKTLENSPMIELTRRKIKTPPACPEKLAIDFDDLDTSFDLKPVPGEKDEVFSASDSFIQLTGTAPVTESVNASNEELHVSDVNKENSVPVMKSLDDTEENIKPATMPNDIEKVPQPTAATCDNEKNAPLDSEPSLAEEKHNVKYFRNLVDSERSRLNGQCATWEVINEAEEKLAEEVKGQIRTTVGQAQLLMDQRFKQFLGLVDNCEFKTGEKETTCSDLQGFWDMIYYQVEDVDKKFEDLKKLKAANWVKEEDNKPTKIKTKKIAPKPTRSKPVAKSKFAAFRAQMKKKTEKVDDGSCEQTDLQPAIKVFDAGFFKVSSPQKTPSPHCAAGGTPSKILLKPSPPVEEKSESSLQDEERKSPAVILNSSCTPVPAFLNRTPRRRSYVPSVPSPLLCDITPSRAKKRRSLRNTPIPSKLLKRREGSTGRSDEDEKEEQVVSPVKRRRHSRSNSKTVSFSEAVVSSTPLSPSSPCAEIPQSPCDLSKMYEYTLPLTCPIITEDNSENDPEKRPKSALKKSKTPKSATRKSVRLSVHFDGSSQEKEKSTKMPHTPVNRNSRVARTRVRSAGVGYCVEDEETDSPVHNTDKENQSPAKTLFAQEISLIGSPLATNNRKQIAESDLICFSP